MFLSRFLKGLSVALSLALMLTLFNSPFNSQQAYAQSDDVECDCSDYEESYLEYKQALQIEEELYAQVLADGDGPALIAYLRTNNLQTALENFIMGKANLEDCQKRVEQNAEMCNETKLTDAEKTSLMENVGRASLGDNRTIQQLMRFLVEDLSIPDHQAEFRLMDGASMEANIKVVIDYLVREHVLDSIRNNENIMKALRDAAIEHLKGRGLDFRDGELTKEELTFLRENTGRTYLDSYDTYDRLFDFFLQDLNDHKFEVGEEYERARDYMLEEHNLMASSDLIKDALFRALKQYLQGLGINVAALPIVPCPDCAAEQKAVNDKQTEIDNKQTELNNAINRQGAAKDELKQFDQDLHDAIEDGCDDLNDGPADNNDYKDVNLGNGEAAGILEGRHFHCRGEAEIDAMLRNLREFRNSHRKRSEIEQDLKDANRDIAVAKVDLIVLRAQKAILDAALAACKRKQKAVPNCPPVVAGGGNQGGGATGGDTTGATADTGTTGGGGGGSTGGSTGSTATDGSSSTAEAIRGGGEEAPIRTTFQYRPTAIDKVVDFRNANRVRLRALHKQFNDKFDSIQNLVNTSGFSDYAKLDTRGRESIEYLTNRIPLFKGEDGGKRFGGSDVLTRAVVAEILYRLAELGGVDYSTDIAGVAQPSDVPADIWFEKSVKAAIKNGVFIPQDNKVRPGDEVNWAELVTILRRFYGLEAINPEVPTFRNVNADEWYTGEFETLVEAEILTRADFALDRAPWEKLTKLQFAQLIHNALGAKASFLE
jgi:hypothetical protein